MFKIGDKVKHKSGGPLMVVFNEGARGPQEELLSCWCQWFDSENRLQQFEFKVDVLIPVSGEPK